MGGGAWWALVGAACTAGCYLPHGPLADSASCPKNATTLRFSSSVLPGLWTCSVQPAHGGGGRLQHCGGCQLTSRHAHLAAQQVRGMRRGGGGEHVAVACVCARACERACVRHRRNLRLPPAMLSTAGRLLRQQALLQASAAAGFATKAAPAALTVPKSTQDAVPTINVVPGQAFGGDLRSTSGLGVGDGIKTHTEKWLDVRRQLLEAAAARHAAAAAGW